MYIDLEVLVRLYCIFVCFILYGMLVEFIISWFYDISTIVGYLMPNPIYTYILNTYDLVWLAFMAYQPL